MTIRASKLKEAVLSPAKKIGIVVTEKSKADEALNKGARVASRLLNEGERRLQDTKEKAGKALAGLKAKIHEATAPEPARKTARTKATAPKAAKKPAAKVSKAKPAKADATAGETQFKPGKALK